MSRISVEGFNHYSVVYGLNFRKFKESVIGHHSAQWKAIEDCLRDIHNIDDGYKKLKAIAEPDSIPQMHHVSLKSKP